MEKIQCNCGCTISKNQLTKHLAGNHHMRMLLNKEKEEFMKDPAFGIKKLDLLLDLDDRELINEAVEKIESIANMLMTKLEYIN
jgi:translation elongation factor EF-1beta